MEIVCFELAKWESDSLKRLCSLPYRSVEEPLGAHNVLAYQNAEIISCFIYSDLNQSILKQLPHLRLIATRSTGFDHIDLAYCNQNGIIVSNVSDYGIHTVAEYVFALLLSLSRHIPQAINQTRNGDFSSHGLRGFDLYGKTMGLIGAGMIGTKTIQIAQGFGMNVLVYDLYPKPELAHQIGFESVDLEKLLKAADIISLHVPGGKQTQNLLSDKEFALMKKGVVLINTSRGSVVDVKALLRALASGKVQAAGLDVLPEEPVIREDAELLHPASNQRHDFETLMANHALLHYKNVIVTPHCAFYTQEAIEKILYTTAQTIKDFIAGCPLQNDVTRL